MDSATRPEDSIAQDRNGGGEEEEEATREFRL